MWASTSSLAGTSALFKSTRASTCAQVDTWISYGTKPADRPIGYLSMHPPKLEIDVFVRVAPATSSSWVDGQGFVVERKEH